MNEFPDILRRRAILDVTLEMIFSRPMDIARALSGYLVIQVEMNYQRNIVHYVCCSPEFPVVGEGVQAPHFRVELETTNNRVRFNVITPNKKAF